MMKLHKLLFFFSMVLVVYGRAIQNGTKITIIHINDFHAHYEEMSPTTAECKMNETCIGGYARLVYMVKYLQEKYKDEHPLYLNAGDNFQGTPWYTMFTWNVTKHFLNLLPADAITLGNHEFDHGIDGLLPFIGSIESRLLVGNVDDASKDFLQQYSKDKIRGRTVVVKDGIRIGIIGVIIQNVPELSNTGNITFLSESKMVKRHARLLALEKVHIIIVLSHCGFEIDKKIAKYGGPLIDVIVGGHSHTFLYNTSDNTTPPEKPQDTYPVVVTQDDGHKVLVVQASAYGKYVGLLKVTFDSDGDVTSWEGNPVYLGENVPQDQAIVEELKPWRRAVNKKGKIVIGTSQIVIDHSNCKKMECNAGNLVTDAMVEAFKNKTNLAIQNGGGIRSSIDAGDIKYNHMLTMIPFGGTFDLVKLSGKTLREMFEHAVDLDITENSMVFRNLLQVSGFKVTYDLKNPPNQRVKKILVLENNKKRTYNELDENKSYYVVVNSFIFRGGDGYSMIKRDQQEHKVGPLDLDAVVDYIKQKKKVKPVIEGRIIMNH